MPTTYPFLYISVFFQKFSKTPEEDAMVDRYGLNPAPYWVVVTLAGATVLFGLLAYSGYQGKKGCSITWHY